MKQQLLISAFALSALFTSCSKSDTTGPAGTNNSTSKKTRLGYQLLAVNKTAGIQQRTTGGGNIQWSAAVASPTLVKFEAKQNGTEQELKSTNNGQIDLMAPVGNVFGNFNLAAGTYTEIELKIQLNAGSFGPALRLTGQFSDGSTTIPVVFQANELLELKAEQENVTITANTSFISVTTLDLSSFTSGVTGAMILGGTLTNGTLLISSSSNPNIYSIIMANIKSMHHSSHFEHD